MTSIKLVLIYVLLFIAGCILALKVIRADKVSKKTAAPKTPTQIDGSDTLNSTIKKLVMQYYKAGWMDASNGCIYLTNHDIFDNGHVQLLKEYEWGQMRKRIDSIPLH